MIGSGKTLLEILERLKNINTTVFVAGALNLSVAESKL
jgi:hypothetical protein